MDNYNSSNNWYNNQPNSYNNNQNSYNNPNNSYNNQQQYQQPYQNQQPYENQVNNKPKKKKKHRFLKFVLFVILVCIVYKGVTKGCDYLAEKEMQSFVVDYPFEFVENNYLGYVTDDFNVISTYTVNDKEYNVEWSSNLSNLVHYNDNGTFEVVRPSDQSRKVILTETYKKLLGKATQQYELNLVSSSVISEDSVEVITLDELRDGSYKRDMRAILKDDGTLNYMIGDFHNTKAYSADDAIVILRAYEEQFNVPSDIEYVLDSVDNSEILIDYKFKVCYSGYPLENSYANLVVDKDTYEVNKIEIEVEELPSEISVESFEIDYETIIENYISNNDESKANYDKLVFYVGEVIYNGKLVKEYNIIFDNSYSYTIYIDSNGDVVDYYSNSVDIWQKPFGAELGVKGSAGGPTELYGKTEYGDEITVDGTIRQNYSGFGGFKYVMHDRKRDIHTYENTAYMGIIKYVANHREEFNNTNGDAVAELKKVGAMLAVLGNSLIAKLGRFEVDSDTPEINDPVALQSQYNLSIAYDWYKDNIGLISYDNNGTPIVIVTNFSSDTDNASWDDSSAIFTVSPTKVFKYSVTGTPEVMCHEYTHAVFNDRLLGNITINDIEAGAINESYADVFGCIISNSKDWVIGKNEIAESGRKIFFRDLYTLKNANGENINAEKIDGYEYAYYSTESTKYKDEYWRDETHAESIILSNVAARMVLNGEFTPEEVAHIYYNSLDYGYSPDSTFLDVREYVVQSAKKYGISKDRIKIIETYFADRGIGEYPEEELPANIIETKSNAVEGDLFLDDTTKGTYLIVWSPAGTYLRHETIYVCQTKNKFNSGKEKEIQAKFDELASSYGEWTSLITNETGALSIKYVQLSEPVMKESIRIAKDMDARAVNILYKTTGTNRGEDDFLDEVITFIYKVSFQWRVEESTAYDMFNDFDDIWELK